MSQPLGEFQDEIRVLRQCVLLRDSNPRAAAALIDGLNERQKAVRSQAEAERQAAINSAAEVAELEDTEDQLQKQRRRVAGQARTIYRLVDELDKRGRKTS